MKILSLICLLIEKKYLFLYGRTNILIKSMIKLEDGTIKFDNNEEWLKYHSQEYIEQSKELYRINEDLISNLMVYDDIEKVSELEWIKFWKEVKAAKIKLRKIVYVQYRKKHVNIFEKYSIDELKKIYEDQNIWAVTDYCILHLQKYKEHEIIDIDNHYTSIGYSLKIDNAKYDIEHERYRSETERRKLIIIQCASEYISKLLKEDDDKHSDMYDFVINNLQYASIDDLKQLTKLAKKDFVINGKGRKSQNKKVFKYDLEHNLLNTYPNRNACIDAEQISKQALYNVLSGKRKQLKGFIYEEEK